MSTKTLEHDRIDATGKDLVQMGADLFEEKIKKCLELNGKAIVGLSGGSTPGPIYQKLGESNELDFNKVFFFLVDERHIDPQHKDSNTLLVNNTLRKSGKVPESNFIHPNTLLPIDQCITDYEERLRTLFSKSSPDVLALGLGPDGHIASLFPPVDIEAASREDKWVLHTTTEKFAVFDRITINFKVIRSASLNVFIMKGKDKLKVWDEMIQDPNNHTRWPAQEVIQDGKTTLLFSTD